MKLSNTSPGDFRFATVLQNFRKSTFLRRYAGLGIRHEFARIIANKSWEQVRNR